MEVAAPTAHQALPQPDKQIDGENDVGADGVVAAAAAPERSADDNRDADVDAAPQTAVTNTTSSSSSSSSSDAAKHEPQQSDDTDAAAVPPHQDTPVAAGSNDDDDQKTDMAGGEEGAAAAAAAAEAAAAETESAPKQTPAAAAEAAMSTPPKLVVPRPALRGTLRRDGASGAVTWTGRWGMDDKAFDGGQLSEFAYKRDAVLDSGSSESAGGVAAAALPEGADAELPRNALFSGHFFLAEKGKKRKVQEKRFTLRFSAPAPGDGDDHLLRVGGDGTNQYGAYSLDGTFNPATGELNVYREYKPRPLLPAVAAASAAPRRGASAADKSRRASGVSAPVSAPARQQQQQQAAAAAAAAARGTRVRRAPSHLVEALDDRETRNFQQLRTIIRDVSRADKWGTFQAPVSAEVPGYHEVIEHPMDLGTVVRKIENKEYGSLEQAIADVRLTFSNAVTFNKAGPVYNLALSMSGKFETKLQTLLASARSAASRKRKSAGGASTSNGKRLKGSGLTMSDIFASDDEDVGFGDEDDDALFGSAAQRPGSRGRRSAGGGGARRPSAKETDELRQLRQQMQMMTKQMQMMHELHVHQFAHQNQGGLPAGGAGGAAGISAPAALPAAGPLNSLGLPVHPHVPAGAGAAAHGAPAAVVGAGAGGAAAPAGKAQDVRPLSYQEMRQLGQDINTLRPDDVPGVLAIIQESGQSFGGDGEEVDLDLEKLDAPTLRKLQKYVKKKLARARRLQSAGAAAV